MTLEQTSSSALGAKCTLLCLTAMLLVSGVAVSASAQALVAPASPTAPPSRDVGSAPAATDEIVTAAQDCVAAISPGRFEREAFRSRGWIMAGPPTTRETRPGLTSQQAMFGRQGGQVLNIINVTGNVLVHCSVVARLDTPAQFDVVRSALITSLELTPANEAIAEERDRMFVQAMPEEDRARVLLSAARRVTVDLQDAPMGPVIRIEIFPKRPLET